MGQLWSLAVGGQEKLVTTPIAAAIRDNNSPEVDHYSPINICPPIDLSLVVIQLIAKFVQLTYPQILYLQLRRLLEDGFTEEEEPPLCLAARFHSFFQFALKFSPWQVGPQ